MTTQDTATRRSLPSRAPTGDGLVAHEATYDGYVAAADIGGTRVRMMLAGLDGKPAANWNIHIGEEKTPGSIVRLLRLGLDTMLELTGTRSPVRHMTAGAPGITDVDLGVVLAAPNLPGWHDVPLRDLLEQEFGIPAQVDNDTNLAALGEHAAGVAQGVDNFLFMALGTGVGAGVFLGGKLHRGATWSAGEVGYLPVHGGARRPVRMHETGQLEQAIGGLGIEARWHEYFTGSTDDEALKLSTLRAPQIFDLANTGDARALNVLRETARVLADALSTLALLFDPQMIVLGGGVGSHPALCTATNGFLRENEFALPMLRSSALGTGAQLFGAVSLSLGAIGSNLRC